MNAPIAGKKPIISVVVPAFNEEKRLPVTLASMRPWLDSLGEEYELIVVDDGSKDQTVALATELTRNWPQLRVVAQGINEGKGAAVRAGMLLATGEIRVFSDADHSTPISELSRLRAHLNERCQVVIASRAARGAVIDVHQSGRREKMGRIYNRLVQSLVLPGIMDSQCGFKVFSAKAAITCFEPLQTKRFGFDAEVLVRAKRAGFEVAEVPVHWHHVEASSVNSLRDSLRMLFDLIVLSLRPTSRPGIRRVKALAGDGSRPG